MLLIFSFRGTIAENVAQEITVPSAKIYLDSSVLAIENFVQHTDFSSYGYILGMGMYSGRDQDKLRIETISSSQFRAGKDNFEQLAIPYFLKSGDGLKLAMGMGNSWCNLVSYKLLKARPHYRYTFLHVPKTFNVTEAASILDNQLKTI